MFWNQEADIFLPIVSTFVGFGLEDISKKKYIPRNNMGRPFLGFLLILRPLSDPIFEVHKLLELLIELGRRRAQTSE